MPYRPRSINTQENAIRRSSESTKPPCAQNPFPASPAITIARTANLNFACRAPEVPCDCCLAKPTSDADHVNHAERTASRVVASPKQRLRSNIAWGTFPRLPLSSAGTLPPAVIQSYGLLTRAWDFTFPQHAQRICCSPLFPRQRYSVSSRGVEGGGMTSLDGVRQARCRAR